MTAKEKVRKFYPYAHAVRNSDNLWWIRSAPTVNFINLSNGLHASGEIAWKIAAESLPAEPEQEWMPCLNVGCGKELNHDGDCDYEYYGPIAPVEAKETSAAAIWDADLENKRIAFISGLGAKLTEPKPTPSTPEIEVVTDCNQLKPQPDSSSISTEQTFEEWWTALFVSYAVEKLDDPYDFAKAAWNAAKGLK